MQTLGIKELGVPIKIAKNITKPSKVNKRNKEFLQKASFKWTRHSSGCKNVLEKKMVKIFHCDM